MAEVFQLGQPGSKTAFVNALTALQTQGAGVLNTIETARLETLVEFDRRLQAINGRRTRAWRVQSVEQAAKFVVSDFTDIDQANTTGTVRADSSTVSLKERAVPAEAVIKTNTFSANKGTIEALDTAQTILRVHTDDGSTPTGQFDIGLVTPLVLSQLIIDIVASPSSPTIVASISNDGLTYTPANQVAINGYRVNVWLPSQETKYIRIQVTPTLPDTLGGNSFTFGITNFSAQATEYHLRSEFLSKVQTFVPKSQYLVFETVDDPNLQFYLSIYDASGPAAPFIEINPGDAVGIGTAVSQTITTLPSLGGLITTIPSGAFLNTIVVTENGVAKKLAPGLLQTDVHITRLANEYVGISAVSAGYNVYLIRSDSNYSTPRTFAISYVYGPSKVNVVLKIRLSTNDMAVSPIFQGATLNDL